MVVRLHENLSQPTLPHRIVFGVELIKPSSDLDSDVKVSSPVEGVPVRVHIQHVHGELVRGQVHRRENLIQCHLIGAIHANLSSNIEA